MTIASLPKSRSSAGAVSGEPWLILSHAFNMDGRAASHTITDKIPYLIARGVEPIVVSAQTGARDAEVEHFQVPAVAPSGLKFDLRHVLKKHLRSPVAYATARTAVSLLLLPFFLVERSVIRLETQWSWFVTAYLVGGALIRSRRPALIYSTGGANCAHLAGYLLSRRFGIPWIAELHDPMIHPQWERSRMSYRFAEKLEQLICRHASAAWWFTEGALARAAERNPELGRRGHMIIPGVAEPDFGGAIYERREKMHIGHFGVLSPSRNLAVFLQALHLVTTERPDYREKVVLDVYGCGLDRASRVALERFPLPGMVVEHGRLEADPATGKSGRQQALEAMRRCDLLLLLHGSSAFCEEYIPSKLFEYLWSRRPVLGLVWKNPQLERILHERGHRFVPALDVERMAAALRESLAAWAADRLDDLQQPSPFTVEDAVTRIVHIADDIRRTRRGGVTGD